MSMSAKTKTTEAGDEKVKFQKIPTILLPKMSLQSV